MTTEIVEELTFKHSDLVHLHEDAQCAFFQAAILLTDLRFFDLALHEHFQFLKKPANRHTLEIGVYFSQVTLLFSHLGGILCEANNVLRQSYFSSNVSREFDSKLSPESKAALSRIKAYFSKRDNLATVIRNNFGFHYDRARIADFIGSFPPDWDHRTYLTGCLNNAFLEFGQICSLNALCKATGASDSHEGLLRLFKELHGQLLKDFVIFFHGLLQVISKSLPFKSQKVRARFSANSPALFVRFDVR